jgi:beta-1,4-mannosyl-glycoprotein beta-1,4-N-acetylglucosaminyltransferase
MLRMECPPSQPFYVPGVPELPCPRALSQKKDTFLSTLVSPALPHLSPISMLSFLPSRRGWVKKVLVATTLFTLVLLFYHRIEVSPAIPGVEDLNKDANGFMTVLEAEERCWAHEWLVYPERKTPRKIYDLFIINTELDWLEIRLNELKDQVDYFIILESGSTFTGLPKPLYLKDHWGQFLSFHHQIIYQVLNDTGFSSDGAWDREAFQRNAMFDQVFPNLSGDQKASLGDVILVSDIDEIPRPETLQLLRNCEYPRRLTLRSRFYYYSFQWLHRGEDWHHPQATIYEGDKTIRPEDLRMGNGGDADETEHDRADLWNASWHCSSCFATIEQMVNKLSSFSHTELNLPEFRVPARIVRIVRNGLDLCDREDELYDRVESNSDIPEYIRAHKEKFSYMIDRDPANANFQDYTVRR